MVCNLFKAKIPSLLYKLYVRHYQNDILQIAARCADNTHFTFNILHFIIVICLCPLCFIGIWLKSEDTVPLKTKRADFSAAIVRGRMIVAGGLGMEVAP